MTIRKGFKGFKDEDVKIKVPYVTYIYAPPKVPIRYKLFNNEVVIDLKSIVEGILQEQGIEFEPNKKIDLGIPYNIEKQFLGNAVSVVIDKRRYTLRLRKDEIIPSKQQKIDYDNTQPYRWNKAQWLKKIRALFWETYGFKALDLEVSENDNETKMKRGKIFGLIGHLRKKVLSIDAFKVNEGSILEYLQWVFHNKAHKTSLTLGLICCDAMIQDWVVHKMKVIRGKKDVSKKKRPWD